MTNMLDAMLASFVKSKTLTPNWEKAYTAAMDSYLGEVPASFQYKGKSYTPRTFADQVIGIKPDEYVGIASVTDHPYYSKFVLLIPDNWQPKKNCTDKFCNSDLNSEIIWKT